MSGSIIKLFFSFSGEKNLFNKIAKVKDK